MTLHDVSRRAARLRPPSSTPSRFDLDDVSAIVVHYSTGDELGQPDAEAWWRGVQAFHQGPQRGWSDIGYSYGIHARQGRILEGRGAGVVGAHSPGWNARSIGIVVLGDDDPGQDVTDDCRRRLVRFRDDVWQLLGRRVHVRGHRDTQRQGYTTCPGDELSSWIAAGMPLPPAQAPAEPGAPSQSTPPTSGPQAPAQPSGDTVQRFVKTADSPAVYLTDGITRRRILVDAQRVELASALSIPAQAQLVSTSVLGSIVLVGPDPS